MKRTALQRFQCKTVKRKSGCIEWTGARSGSGYGSFSLDGKIMNAHRAALLLAGIAMTPELQACHRCNNRLCVNVDHLYAGTARQNLVDSFLSGSRGEGPRARFAKQVEMTDKIQASLDSGNQDELLVIQDAAKLIIATENSVSQWIDRGASGAFLPVIGKKHKRLIRRGDLANFYRLVSKRQ